MASLTVATIIANRNGRACLEECLSALFAQARPLEHVLLVNFDSADGSAAFVREHYPQVQVWESGGNLSFAASINTALSSLTTDLVLLLDSGVILPPDCLATIEATIAHDPDIGIVDGNLWLPNEAAVRPPGSAVMAVRRDLFERIGPMDEELFALEDADLRARATRAGYRVAPLPVATSICSDPTAAGQDNVTTLYRYHCSRWRYLLKHLPIEEITAVIPGEETAWLNHLNPVERRAAGLACLATRQRLPEIWLAREREGAGPISLEEQQTAVAVLANLQAVARHDAIDSEALGRLSAAAALQEKPFASQVPLLGPLIVWFRTAWNNIASRWYVDHYVTQQNEFNRLAVEQIGRYEAELNEMMSLLEEQVILTAEAQQRVGELQERLATLELPPPSIRQAVF